MLITFYAVNGDRVSVPPDQIGLVESQNKGAPRYYVKLLGAFWEVFENEYKELRKKIGVDEIVINPPRKEG